MPPRKRKVTYPTPRTAKKRPFTGLPGEQVVPVRPTVATIDLTAGKGRSDLAVGDRVRILGNGLYAGELATVERFAGSAVPAAVVRTEAGRTRQVRTIDLEPVGAGRTGDAAAE